MKIKKCILIIIFSFYSCLAFGQVNNNSFETGKLLKIKSEENKDSVLVKYDTTINKNGERIIKVDTIKKRTNFIEEHIPGNFLFFPNADDASFEKNLNIIYGNDDFGIVNSVNLAFAKNGGTLYTELLSDFLYLSHYAGYAKVGFGMLVQSSKDSVVTSLNNFFTKGGNILLYVNYPLIYWYGERDKKKLARGDLSFVPKVAGELPQLNSTINNPTLNMDIGFEGDLSISTISSKLQFFTMFRTGFLMWGSDNFYKSINWTNDIDKNFFYTNLNLGVEINGMYRLSVSKPIWPTPFSFKKDTPVSFTLTFIPDKGKPDVKREK